jgi:hypothetical protein
VIATGVAVGSGVAVAAALGVSVGDGCGVAVAVGVAEGAGVLVAAMVGVALGKLTGALLGVLLHPTTSTSTIRDVRQRCRMTQPPTFLS